MRQQESKKAYEASKRRESGTVTARTPRGESYDRAVEDLKQEPNLNYEPWQSRQSRKDRYYANYYNRPSPFAQTYYSDPYGNVLFWLWLSDKPVRERDTWVYNRRDSIDPARMEELRAKDRDLDRRLAELERQGVPRDPTYVPQYFKDNKDLMYGDDVVETAYKEKNKSSFPWFWVIGFPLMLFGTGYLGYFFFFKKMVRASA